MEQNRAGTKRVDIALLLSVLALILFGMVMLYSTSSYNGLVKFADRFYYLKKQFFATSLGLAAMYVVSQIDYHLWAKFSVAGYALSAILSTLVLFIGQEINGSKRWLALGPLSFQPSEFAKVALIIFLAWIVTKQGKRIVKLKTMLLVIISALPIVGLVGSNNLSTAIIILGIAVVLIFVASPKYLQFLAIGGLGIVFITLFLATASYRLERLAIWLDPEKYEKGYQTLQGLYAIGSGGVFGVGIGNGKQKLGFVPEAQNDMIFSIICEELGLFGAGMLILLFGILIWRLMVVASHTKDLFGCLVVTGIMAHILIQVILNIAVVTNTIPNTGITLPFVSYGGTSVLFLLAEMGIALNVSLSTRKEH